MKVNKFILLMLIGGTLVNCTSHTPVGADRDEYGCIGSAGYVWSPSLQQCVRLWEVGKEITSSAFGTSVAYFILNKNDNNGELWLPNDSNPIEMKKSTIQNKWINTERHIEVVENQKQFRIYFN